MADTATQDRPLTKADLVEYLAEGCKPPEQWRIGAEHEKFIFYRGVGDIPLPVAIVARAGGQVAIKNTGNEGLRGCVLVRVDAGQLHYRALGALNAMRDRMDELQKRVRGLEELEQRLTALERKVEKLSKGEPASSASRPSSKTTSTKSSGGSRAKKS